jgi:hypothetical protein
MPSSPASAARCARSRASVPKARLAAIVLRTSPFPLHSDRLCIADHERPSI